MTGMSLIVQAALGVTRARALFPESMLLSKRGRGACSGKATMSAPNAAVPGTW